MVTKGLSALSIIENGGKEFSKYIDNEISRAKKLREAIHMNIDKGIIERLLKLRKINNALGKKDINGRHLIEVLFDSCDNLENIYVEFVKSSQDLIARHKDVTAVSGRGSAGGDVVVNAKNKHPSSIFDRSVLSRNKILIMFKKLSDYSEIFFEYMTTEQNMIFSENEFIKDMAGQKSEILDVRLGLLQELLNSSEHIRFNDGGSAARSLLKEMEVIDAKLEEVYTKEENIIQRLNEQVDQFKEAFDDLDKIIKEFHAFVCDLVALSKRLLVFEETRQDFIIYNPYVRFLQRELENIKTYYPLIRSAPSLVRNFETVILELSRITENINELLSMSIDDEKLKARLGRDFLDKYTRRYRILRKYISKHPFAIPRVGH